MYNNAHDNTGHYDTKIQTTKNIQQRTKDKTTQYDTGQDTTKNTKPAQKYKSAEHNATEDKHSCKRRKN